MGQMIVLFCLVVPIPAQAGQADTDDERNGIQPTTVSIQQFRDRVDRNPADYSSWVVLGRLYLRQAKEEDVVHSFRLAEAAFREALKFKSGDRIAMTFLAVSLQSQHRFPEALEIAKDLLEKYPENVQAMVTAGDAHLELGQLPEAEKLFDHAAERAPVAAVLVRQANLAELNGDAIEAIRLAELARDKAVAMSEIPGQIAWYELRIGVMRFRHGKFEQATRNFEKCLELDVGQTQALVYLARIYAAQQNIEKAIKLTKQAIAITAEPPTTALLGDLLAVSGQQVQADKHYDRAQSAMEEEADILEFAHLRERALFYLNHDRKPSEALKLAQKDLQVRQDVYTYDTLAWALFKNDRAAEAKDAMKKALSFGTRDAEIFYHAGVIEQELNNIPGAIKWLEQSIKVSPFFCPVHSGKLNRRLMKMKQEMSNKETASAAQSN